MLQGTEILRERERERDVQYYRRQRHAEILKLHAQTTTMPRCTDADQHRLMTTCPDYYMPSYMHINIHAKLRQELDQEDLHVLGPTSRTT